MPAKHKNAVHAYNHSPFIAWPQEIVVGPPLQFGSCIFWGPTGVQRLLSTVVQGRISLVVGMHRSLKNAPSQSNNKQTSFPCKRSRTSSTWGMDDFYFAVILLRGLKLTDTVLLLSQNRAVSEHTCLSTFSQHCVCFPPHPSARFVGPLDLERKLGCGHCASRVLAALRLHLACY